MMIVLLSFTCLNLVWLDYINGRLRLVEKHLFFLSGCLETILWGNLSLQHYFGTYFRLIGLDGSFGNFLHCFRRCRFCTHASSLYLLTLSLSLIKSLRFRTREKVVFLGSIKCVVIRTLL